VGIDAGRGARVAAGLVGVALAAWLLGAPPPRAAAAECPNAQLRFEDNSLFLPDCRAYEMVSPVDKNGGAVARFGAIAGGGVLQAAASGEAATFSSAASFGAGAVGAPVASQYISRRGGGGWTTENITGPTASGDYGEHPEGVPYQLFSEDLGRGLLLNGRRCEEGEPCPRSYSLRDSASGALTPLPEEAAGMRVFDASPDLSRILFEDEAGEDFEWRGGGLVPISPPPPPNTGPTRTSGDGLTVAFLSKESLTGYDNTDQSSGEPDSEVFIENAGGLHCVSCNPSGEPPLGPSTIPGAIANCAGPNATRIYKPRDLSANGLRLFFDSSDQIVNGDASGAQDVYEWEAPGAGSCAPGSPGFFATAGGCIFLISSGSSPQASEFVDASADGRDAFFLSSDSLIETDSGSVDLYDAREGGGFPLPPPQIPCEGDACQHVPSPPEDPSPGTLVPGSPNPPVHFPPTHCPKGTHRVVRHGKSLCLPRHRKHGHAHSHRRGAK
jgi:hypothetical protein